jgi:hypothetical protein
MTLDQAVVVAEQVAHTTHVEPAVVERAAVLLAAEVKRLGSQPGGGSPPRF